MLLLLLFLALGADSAFMGCGLEGDGSAGIACRTSCGDNPCDYIVTVQATVLLDADDSPVQGATVTISSDPPNGITTTRTTDDEGIALWDDTSLLTRYSADCDGVMVGTVEPYNHDTLFTYDVLVSAPGLAPAATVLAINRQSRDIALVFRLAII